MPVYEYKCESCEQHFETLRKMSEMNDVITCPHCGSNETKRQMSVFGVGSGCNSRSSNMPPLSCKGG